MHQFFYCASKIEEVYRRAVISCDLEKLELFSTDYLFEYVEELLRGINYRNYLANSVRALVEVTARIGGGKINYPIYNEITKIDSEELHEKTAEEIIEEVTQKAGLTAM